MRAIRALGLAMIFLPCIASAVVAAPDPTETRCVLLLHSYNQQISWTADLQRGVVDSLVVPGADIDLHVENMDSKIFNSPGYFEAFRAMLAVKYAAAEFDLVLVADNNAFTFLADHRDDLFPGVPVVFGGINGFEPAMLDGFPGATGVAEVYSVRETVDLALRLHPDTRRLYVVNDHLVTGRATARGVDDQLAGLAPGLEVVHAENLTLAEHCAALAALDPGTLVLLGVFYADRDGHHTTFEEIGASLVRASAVPVYCLLGFNLDSGAVGGKVVAGYWQGVAMARQARPVLQGADPSTVPVVAERANHFIMNHAELVRWDLAGVDLPAGTSVLGRPMTLWNTHRREVVALALVGSLMVAAILVLTENIRRRRSSERALRRSEENLAITLRSIGDAVMATDRDGRIVRLNPQAAELTGWEEQAARGRLLSEVLDVVHAETGAPLADPVARVLEAKAPVEAIQRGLLRSRGGRERIIEDSGAPILRANGEVAGVVLVFRDVTHKVEVEERLRHAQKMEAVGQLAGGVAHDFNNMLAGIMGYADMLKSEPVNRRDQTEFAGHILTAASRAADLTRKLLAFSRKGKVLSTPVDVHDLVGEAVSLLERSVDRRIELVVDLAADNCSVIGDPTQIQQAVLNLAINARDAMPAGGTLTLGTVNRWVDTRACERSNFPIVPGDYLVISVQDTGPGIPRDVATRIFEPFFTTKAVGEGTGLGLAAVRGTVEEHLGAVEVDTVPGAGACFRILLPLSGLPAQRLAMTDDRPLAGEGTVLVVDDEEIIVSMVRRMLRGLGYDVLTASDGVEGLEVFRNHRESISVVLLDMVMPRMTGRDCFREIRRLDPGAQVILASGFTSDHTVSDLMEEGLAAFLKKPYRQTDLVRTLARILRPELDKA